mmetsp:Transcript_2035/g.5902  ORF Transcript_2035/g.5902 Transcript_2035/m.5902 type:complete len:212 (+) Transcript_2035:480-1115(+)
MCRILLGSSSPLLAQTPWTGWPNRQSCLGARGLGNHPRHHAPHDGGARRGRLLAGRLCAVVKRGIENEVDVFEALLQALFQAVHHELLVLRNLARRRHESTLVVALVLVVEVLLVPLPIVAVLEGFLAIRRGVGADISRQRIRSADLRAANLVAALATLAAVQLRVGERPGVKTLRPRAPCVQLAARPRPATRAEPDGEAAEVDGRHRGGP